MKLKNIKAGILAMVLCATASLSGCGSSNLEEFTEAGFNNIANNQYSAALQSFASAEEKGEDPMMIARGRGIANYYMMNYEDAVNNYLECLSDTGGKVSAIDFDVNYYLAQAYEKMGDFQSAADTYTSIIDLKDKEVIAYYYRGTDYLILGEHDLAVADFDKALSLDENNYDLRIEIAGRLSENYYEEEGIKYLQDFLAEKEKKLSSYDKGRIYYYMGDLENAKVFLEDARDDDDQRTVLFLGMTYEKLGDYSYAGSVYDNFLKRHPESAAVFNQLGLCKLASGDYAAAENAFASAKSIENSGLEQTLAFNEIVAAEYVGDFKKAKSLMSTYVSKYPDDEIAARENIFLSTR